MKPFYKKRKIGFSRRESWYVNVPFCGNCKRQLGLIALDKKIEECPMCHEKIEWTVNHEQIH